MSVPAWEQALNGAPTRVLYGRLPDEPSEGLIVNTMIIGSNKKTAPSESCSSEETKPRLCLFKLSMLADGSLAATIRFKYLGATMDIASGFYLGYQSPDSENLYYIDVEISSPLLNQVQDKMFILFFPAADSHLVEIGVYDLGLIEYPRPLALYQIFNITIKPRNQAESSWTIDGVRVTKRGNSLYHDKRLVWKWSGSDDPSLTFLPWSKTTGPFSYFRIMIGNKELGRAYCMEFPIHSEDFDKGEGVEVIIRGRLFGNGEVTSLPLRLSKDKLDAL